jgi:heterotetrameric sarcosine oxidase gamma subunit
MRETNAPIARSPFARRLTACGAQVGRIGHWEVALRCPDDPEPGPTVEQAVWVADITCLPKWAYYGAQAARRVAALLGGDRETELVPGAVVGAPDADRALCLIRPTEVLVIAQRMDAPAIEADDSLLVVERTGGLGSLALGGGAVESVLQRLTAFDVAEATFPSGRCALTRVAEVRALLLHLGTSYYQLHIERAEAEHVWDALLAAGQAFGLRPMGWNAYCSMVDAGAGDAR